MKTLRSCWRGGKFLILPLLILACEAKVFAQTSVFNTNLPPVVEISTPTNGQTFLAPASISILAPTYDPDGSDGFVKTVAFFADYQLLGVYTNPPPPPPGSEIPIVVPHFLWTNVLPGNYRLTAVATDFGGLNATSAPVIIRVPPGPPVAHIYRPTNGATFFAPVNIPIYATASASNGLASVEFFADGHDLGPGVLDGCTTPDPIPICIYSLVWSNAPVGVHVLSAVVTDHNGFSNTSASVNVTVLQGPAVTHGYITAVLRSACANAPTPPPLVGDTRMGSNYVIETVADADPMNWTNAQQLVTDSIFESLMPLYCGLPKTGCVTDSVQWNIITYDTNGTPMISGCAASGCQYHSCEELSGPAVVFTQPSDQSVYAGQTAKFSVVASGAPPLNYQWVFDGTNILDGATNAVLVLPDVQTNQAGIYQVAVWNSLGGTNSQPATLTVNPGPLPTNLPPVVTIHLVVLPTNGVTFPVDFATNGETFTAPANFRILAPASDPDGVVKTVAFFENKNLLGIFTNPPPPPPGFLQFSPVFLWTNVPPGDYVLTAVATDNGDVSTTSAPVNITVLSSPSPTNLLPIVRIVSPADGSVFRAPINLPLFAYFTYPHVPFECGSVGLYDGTNFLGVAHPVPMPPTALSTNIYELIWTNAPVGIHVLTAGAVVGNLLNALVLRIVSTPVNITILPPLPPPTNRPPIVSIVATDPVAVEGTNCWVWRGETNSPPTWEFWPTAACRFFTNCGPKTATFTVRRFGDTNYDLTVPYDVGGTASNGVDYVALPGYVNIPAGDRRALITIIPIDDGPPDVKKTVMLTLLPDMRMSPLPGYLLGFPRRAAVIILDRGPCPVTGMLSGHYFHLKETGPNAAWFCIEYSTNLVNWTPVCTNQVINGSIDFVDPDAATNPSRFYRAVPLTNPPSE